MGTLRLRPGPRRNDPRKSDGEPGAWGLEDLEEPVDGSSNRRSQPPGATLRVVDLPQRAR